MDSQAPARTQLPAFATTTRLFARALGWSPQQLLDTFRPATADDLPALLDFRRRDGWDDAAYLRWRYGLDGREHPYGRLWILRSEVAVLGIIGSERQPVRYDGHLYDGQVLMDVQIDPALADAGAGAWFNQAMFEQGDPTLAVGANDHSVGLVRRLFQPLPNRSYYMLPLEAAALLRQRGTPAAVAALAGPLFNAGWWLRERMRYGRGEGGLQITEVASVDPRWLQDLYDALPARIACVTPSAGHLEWRLFRNPRAGYRLFVATRDGRCTGYLAARHVPAAEGQPAALHIIDWKTMADDATLPALMRAAIAQARHHGCSKVFTTTLDAPAGATLARLGFLCRQAPMLVAGVHSSLPLPGHGAPGQWRITDLSFDNDGSY